MIGGGGIPAVGTGDFTVCAIVNVSAASEAAGRVLNEGGGSGITPFYIKRNSSVDSRVSIYDGVLDASSPSGSLVDGVASACGIVRSGSTTSAFYGSSALASIGTSTASLPAAVYAGKDLTGSSGSKFAGSFSKLLFFNYALTADEIAALTRRGLVTLPEQRGGSMTALNTSAWTQVTLTGFTSANGQSWSCAATSEGYAVGANTFATSVGRRFLVTFTATVTTTDQLRVYLNGASPETIAVNGANSIVLTSTANAASTYVVFRALTGNAVTVTGISIIPLGTLFEQDSGQRNAGYMVGDTSGNKLHLELPATGVSIVDPSNVGTINYSRASDGWIIGDRQVIPTGHVIDFILLRVTSGTATAYLGSTAGASDIVSSRTLTTSWTKVLDPVESSTGKVHLTRSTGTVEIQIVTRLV